LRGQYGFPAEKRNEKGIFRNGFVEVSTRFMTFIENFPACAVGIPCKSSVSEAYMAMTPSVKATAAVPLEAFLFQNWPDMKRTTLRQYLKFGSVSINDRVVTRRDHILRPGDRVSLLPKSAATPEPKLGGGLKMVFEDQSLVVIEKPSGLLSIASKAETEKTAYIALTDYIRGGREKSRDRIWIVHRLDRETSGLMVFARTEDVKHLLQDGWEQVTKRYFAIVEGVMPTDAGTIESYLDESNPYRVFAAPKSEATRHAITHYKVLQRTAHNTLVELTLETGRRHQIRVHLSNLGFPVMGDEKYRAKTKIARRLALHSCALEFDHPITGKHLSFSSPLPKELKKLLK
jgi:23S rRNA pseudouridine1911/1915/1917 synthase